MISGNLFNEMWKAMRTGGPFAIWQVSPVSRKALGEGENLLSQLSMDGRMRRCMHKGTSLQPVACLPSNAAAAALAQHTLAIKYWAGLFRNLLGVGFAKQLPSKQDVHGTAPLLVAVHPLMACGGLHLPT